jgi:hypothetical protein
MGAEIRRKLLEEAAEIVSKDRAQEYEEPEQSFGTIAKLWDVYLKAKLDPTITPADVSLLMVLLKVARLINNPTHWDSTMDIAGYAACLADVAAEMSPPKLQDGD